MTYLLPFSAFFPEMVLFITALLSIIVGVLVAKEEALRYVTFLTITGFIVSLGVIFHLHATYSPQGLAFEERFIFDSFAVYIKTLILIGGIITLLMSRHYNHLNYIEKFEYPLLITLTLLGMMVMVSANHFIVLYMGLELQSLGLYILAAFRRNCVRSCEAGLKYFLLGSLSSAILLFGCSWVYGFGGSLHFGALAENLYANPSTPGLVLGMVFLISGLAFKIAAVPFHMWIPDVYEGAPTPVTAYFSVVAKIAAFALFIRVLTGPFSPLFQEWQSIIFMLSVGSMIVGALGAIGQTKIKRLIAYSSIGHVGYALMALSAGDILGVQAVLIYLGIYLMMGLGVFACILSMSIDGLASEDIHSLSGLSRNHPGLALIMLVLMFSLAGIPPFAGFFAKYYVFIAVLNAQLYPLAIIGALTSVVSAFYYLRVIKIMYFEQPATPFDTPKPTLRVVAFLSAASVSFFLLWPSPLITAATNAAASLF